MLGRQATKIQLSRDSDLEELEQAQNRHNYKIRLDHSSMALASSAFAGVHPGFHPAQQLQDSCSSEEKQRR